MKKNLTLAILALAMNSAIGQNNTAKYDSTRNFLGQDAYQYIGQELYLKGKPEDFRSYGYENFVNDINYVKKETDMMDANTFKPGGVLGSKYSAIAEHYFKVLEVLKNPKAAENAYLYGTKLYFKLEDKNTKETVYFLYDTTSDSNFPFIVSGYLEKQKKTSVGKQFVFADAVFGTSKDYATGKPITVVTGDKWKCTDVIVDPVYYNLSLALQNSAGEKATIMIESVYGLHPSGSVYTAKEADSYRSRYGSDFDVILKGHVKVGWTKVMCSLAWGEPDHVNPTTTSAGRTEQWVYKDDHYLYFDETGKLTTIQ